MSRSEEIAAAFAVLAAGVPLAVVGWETLVAPHPSFYSLLLIPLSLLILLVISTAITRRVNSSFWRTAQSINFYLALAAGIAATIAVGVVGWRGFTRPKLEEPGLLLMVLTAALVPACLYTCFVVWIDQRKFARFRLWKVFAAAGGVPVLLILVWGIAETVG